MSDAADPAHRAYLDALPADRRAPVAALLGRARAHLPAVDGCISYQMPAWRLAGSTGTKQVVIGVANFARHIGVYPFSGSVIPQLGDEVRAAGLGSSKSGVSLRPDQELPDALLTAIIDLRLREIG